MSSLPISFRDVIEARARIGGFLKPTPVRNYPELNFAIGNGMDVFVKHENHQLTNAFKIRNAFSALSVLSSEQHKNGVVAATRGNHGQGVALAAQILGTSATICVPEGNSAEKNSAIKSFGARLIERGKDYDESVLVMKDLVAKEGLVEIHSTNNPHVIAGAATMTLELLEEVPSLDALVYAVGGGSQAVGALAVARAINPEIRVYGVQAEGASAIHDSWHSGNPITYNSVDTFADGLATRSTYELTFPALKSGLAGFVTVTDSEIAKSVNLILRTSHNLVEGAGAAGLAGLIKLRNELKGKKIGIVFSGGNIDQETLKKVLNNEI